MIYTLTLNPALDYVLKVDKLGFDDINRAYESRLFFGGKGINVSAVLTRLKAENIALGFVGGFSGKKLEELLKEEGIKTDFIEQSDGETRINVKIRAEKELDINASGTPISDKDILKLIKKLDDIKSGDFLVLAGFLAGYIKSGDYKEALRLGTACANATAYSEGIATKEKIEEYI